jgi:hypothetical protein
MQTSKLLKLLSFLAVLAIVTCATAQQIRFEDFSNQNAFNALLAKNGTVTQATYNGLAVMRLTDGSSNNRPNGVTASSAWFVVTQPVTSGFTTYFQFVIHNPAQCCTPGDGMAFVIQNSSSTNSSFGATGAGRTALGVGNGGVGYAGIPSSIAVEFDTAQDSWDPTPNHVALQTCGTKTDTPVHLPGQYTIGQNHNVTSCLYSQSSINSSVPPLGLTCNGETCTDGSPVTVVVEYTGPPSVSNDPYHLQVYVNPPLIPGTHTPAPNAVAQINLQPFILNQTLVLNNAAGATFVGFTAGYGNKAQTTDVIAWEFTPHTPTQIQQQITNDGSENQFQFGDHVYGVTYPPNNFSVDMTVNAIPVGQTDFYNTRLKNNTTFNNEQCITYLSTGGKCIVYEVTCQDPNTQQPIPCPDPGQNQFIQTRTSYSTTDPVNAGNADYIKAPIGTNTWCSIFTSFTQNDIDPTTSGKGNNFSDFVATFKTSAGADPTCPGSQNSSLFRKLPTNAATTTGETASAGGNK